VTVQLKAEPSRPEWTKVCGKDQGADTETCYTTRDFVTQGQRIVAVALYDAKCKGAQKTLRILTPLDCLGAPGIRITVDQSQPAAGGYAGCLPHGRFAEAAVRDDFVAAIKKGTTLNVSVRGQGGQVVTLAVPTAGIGRALDGPLTDPHVLTEQQKKMQEEPQKRSEALRKRLISQSSEPT
jgi:invasion protein IalB